MQLSAPRCSSGAHERVDLAASPARNMFYCDALCSVLETGSIGPGSRMDLPSTVRCEPCSHSTANCWRPYGNHLCAHHLQNSRRRQVRLGPAQPPLHSRRLQISNGKNPRLTHHRCTMSVLWTYGSWHNVKLCSSIGYMLQPDSHHAMPETCPPVQAADEVYMQAILSKMRMCLPRCSALC